MLNSDKQKGSRAEKWGRDEGGEEKLAIFKTFELRRRAYHRKHARGRRGGTCHDVFLPFHREVTGHFSLSSLVLSCAVCRKRSKKRKLAAKKPKSNNPTNPTRNEKLATINYRLR
jgi:hypothetical protein